MSALDVIELPGSPGKWARRAAVDAWVEAGSPPVNSAGRLHGEQKELYDGWLNRLPGYSPADNPDDETQRLAHVRFVGLDITPTPERVRRLAAAGLVRPYSYEPWHWELPNVRSYAIVLDLPGSGSTATPQKGTVMAEAIVSVNKQVIHLRGGGRSVFANERDYNTFRDQVTFLRARGATDLMPLPALAQVPAITPATHDFLCDYIGAPRK